MATITGVQVLVVSVQHRQPQLTGDQAPGQLLRQTDLVPPEHHQVHGGQELLQTETPVLGDV